MNNQKHENRGGFLNQPKKGVVLMSAKRIFLTLILTGIMATAAGTQSQGSGGSPEANDDEDLAGFRRLSESKKIDRPSAEMLGANSFDGLLTFLPRFCGALSGSVIFTRFVIQMSPPPAPPGRSDVKKSDSPSDEMLGPPSKAGLLTVGPRLVGGPKPNRASSRRFCAAACPINAVAPRMVANRLILHCSIKGSCYCRLTSCGSAARGARHCLASA
jgi:hypothetical protein